LIQLVLAALSKTLIANLGPNLNGSANLLLGFESTPDRSHRLPVGTERGFHIQLESSAPAFATVIRQFALWLPTDAGGDDDIQLVIAGGTEIALVGTDRDVAFSARMDELIPSISGVLQIRLGIFSDREIGEMLVQLKRLAESSMRR
jgi:hypothetical protein